MKRVMWKTALFMLMITLLTGAASPACAGYTSFAVRMKELEEAREAWRRARESVGAGAEWSLPAAQEGSAPTGKGVFDETYLEAHLEKLLESGSITQEAYEEKRELLKTDAGREALFEELRGEIERELRIIEEQLQRMRERIQAGQEHTGEDQDPAVRNAVKYDGLN